jgi:tetratricopeptide (TPR) repeat protein
VRPDDPDAPPPDDRAQGPDTPDREPADEPSPPDVDALLDALAERETAYGLLQRGTSLLARRHHAQAAVVLERARHLEPGKGSIIEPLARAYYNGGQIQEAADAFAQLLEIDPSAAYGHFGLGQALKRLGRRDEARRHLRIAVFSRPAQAPTGTRERLG